jgi:hypothetical protein
MKEVHNMALRKFMKKAASCILAAAFVTGTFAANPILEMKCVVMADEYETCTVGNTTYTYTTYSKGFVSCARISGISSTDTEIEIPESLEGYTVDEIEAKVFQGNTEITKVILPDTVTYIASSAFSGCTALEEVVLSSALTEIMPSTFSGCTALKKVDLKSGITELREGCFSRCKSLEQINLPETLKVIDCDAFSGCESLKNISLPDSIEKIYSYAFYSTALESVVIPNDTVTIANRAFGWRYVDGTYEIIHQFKFIGKKGSSAEYAAKANLMIFQADDGSETIDYNDVTGCLETTTANFDSAIDYLNEYYIEKYPDMAFDLVYDTEEDREFFKGVAASILEENPELEAPYALYNWMNENISTPKDGSEEYGYPVDVYNFRTADCEGNACLLCELLRSAGIPAVIFYGYTGDMENEINESMLLNGELVGHAWVMAYYNDEWILLDSAMDRVLSDKGDICKLYYTVSVDQGTAVYNTSYNFGIEEVGVYFKDGVYDTYGYGSLNSGIDIGSAAECVSPEDIFNVYNKMPYGTYVDTGEAVEAAPGKEGWVNYYSGVVYQKKNGFICAYDFREKDGKLYHFNQNGYAIDVTDLKGRYRTKYGVIVVDVGTEFTLSPFLSEEAKEDSVVWRSGNESIVKVDEQNNFTAVGKGEVQLYADIYDENGSSTQCLFYNIFVDDFVTELSMEDELKLDVGDSYTLSVEMDKESKYFGKCTWESSDKNVAIVDSQGKVTAVGEGTAEITATYCDGSGLNAVCTVTVGEEEPDILDENISFDTSDNTVNGITISTSYESLKLKFSVEITIFDHDGNAVDNSSGIVKTGDVIRYYDKDEKKEVELEVVIKGDSSGDGIIDVLDMETLQKDILGITRLDGAYKKAGQISGEKDISVLDMEAVQKDILGIAKIK